MVKLSCIDSWEPKLIDGTGVRSMLDSCRTGTHMDIEWIFSARSWVWRPANWPLNALTIDSLIIETLSLPWQVHINWWLKCPDVLILLLEDDHHDAKDLSFAGNSGLNYIGRGINSRFLESRFIIRHHQLFNGYHHNLIVFGVKNRILHERPKRKLSISISATIRCGLCFSQATSNGDNIQLVTCSHGLIAMILDLLSAFTSTQLACLWFLSTNIDDG